MHDGRLMLPLVSWEELATGRAAEVSFKPEAAASVIEQQGLIKDHWRSKNQLWMLDTNKRQPCKGTSSGRA